MFVFRNFKFEPFRDISLPIELVRQPSAQCGNNKDVDSLLDPPSDTADHADEASINVQGSTGNGAADNGTVEGWLFYVMHFFL